MGAVRAPAVWCAVPLRLAAPVERVSTKVWPLIVTQRLGPSTEMAADLAADEEADKRMGEADSATDEEADKRMSATDEAADGATDGEADKRMSATDEA
ncbi:MAG: hypothetical protein DDG60_11130, partial [Anaerolineae bacterium]